MRKLKVILVILFLGVLSLLLIPRKYKVESFKERKGTQYWQLATGSKIGYTKIAASKSEKKSPIIYLHGGPGGMIKDKVIEGLKSLRNQGHDIYFYDQIGSGHSDRLKDIAQYSVKRHQQDLKEIVSKIGAKKVILFGHSWGSCLAINYLQDYSEDVEKIILTGPGPILPISKTAPNEIPPDSLSLIEPEYSNKEGNEKAYNWRSKLIFKWAKLFHSKLASDEEVDAFFTYLNQELSKSTNCTVEEQKNYEGGSGYYSHIMTLNSLRQVPNKRDKLKNINTPILILRGQCDNQKWGYTKEYLDIFTNSRLEIIEGAGHDITNSDYHKLISEFLLEKLEFL